MLCVCVRVPRELDVYKAPRWPSSKIPRDATAINSSLIALFKPRAVLQLNPKQNERKTRHQKLSLTPQ